MTIELAVGQPRPKPWGSHDLTPWSMLPTGEDTIGELWFQRQGACTQKTTLLLKLLFTEEPLSIQVHPDDAYAQSLGLPNGKTEAWYILSAKPEAKIAIGFKTPLSADQLREAIENGSIADLVAWHPVRKGDFFFIPAGTIHAIGTGIVLAEIQQQSDTTFRLFDYGRNRELHVENAVSAIRPARDPSPPQIFDGARTVLVEDEHFVLERIACGGASSCHINADRETWILLLEGDARIGHCDVGIGDVVFLEAAHAQIDVGSTGLVALLAYLGPKVEPEIFTPRHRWTHGELPHPHTSTLYHADDITSRKGAQT